MAARGAVLVRLGSVGRNAAAHVASTNTRAMLLLEDDCYVVLRPVFAARKCLREGCSSDKACYAPATSNSQVGLSGLSAAVGDAVRVLIDASNALAPRVESVLVCLSRLCPLSAPDFEHTRRPRLRAD